MEEFFSTNDSPGDVALGCRRPSIRIQALEYTTKAGHLITR